MKGFPFGFSGLIVFSIVAGLVGDALLRVGPPGVNVTLWAVPVLALVVWRAPYAGALREPSSRVPLLAALGFSVLFSWRDAEPLKLLLLSIIMGSIALGSAAALGRSMRAAYVWDYVLDGLNFAAGAAAIPFALLGRTQEAAREHGREVSPVIMAVLRGLLIAAPMLLVFGALLASADALFEKFVDDVFDLERMGSHAMVTGACAWGAAAAWSLCLTPGARSPVNRGDPNRPFRWGVIEINVALGLVAALFVAFIAVQARYFFGGHERVLRDAGLTYADYARRGFFELTWVAGIALALLVNCARVMTGAGSIGRRAYKIVAWVLIVCILLIIASALHRMSLYIDAYDLTRLRLYTTLFMGWMAAVFLWLGVTIYRERVRSFAWGFLLSGYAATVVVLAINPDAIVARTNLARAQTSDNPSAGGRLDAEYLRELSADAVPAIVEGLPSLDASDRAAVREILTVWRDEYARRPLRTWTLGLEWGRAALAKSPSTRAAVN